MTLTFGSWCCTLLFRLWTMGILPHPLFQNCYWSSKKEHLKAGNSCMGERGPLCWGRRLVQVAQCAAAGWALGDGSPEKSPWTADPLCNKGLVDLWLRQVRKTQRCSRSGGLQTPEHLDRAGIKAQGFPLPSPSLEAPISSCYFVISPQLRSFKDPDVWNSAVGNLKWRWWGTLVWLHDCGMWSYEGAAVTA